MRREEVERRSARVQRHPSDRLVADVRAAQRAAVRNVLRVHRVDADVSPVAAVAADHVVSRARLGRDLRRARGVGRALDQVAVGVALQHAGLRGDGARPAGQRPVAVDEEGLPLVYDKTAIQAFWDKQGGALQKRWAEFLGLSVPFLTRVATLLDPATRSKLLLVPISPAIDPCRQI